MTDMVHLRALLAGTILPWHVDASDPEDVVVWASPGRNPGRWIANVGAWDNDGPNGPATPTESAADADLIVEAVNALPGLLDELERLRSLEDVAREVHYLMDEDAEPEDESYICGGCGLPWPCRVAAAFTESPR